MAAAGGGRTLGSPITLEIANRDWENWRQVMAVDAAEVKRKPITRVRPGHADLAGMLKYGADGARRGEAAAPGIRHAGAQLHPLRRRRRGGRAFTHPLG